METKTELTQEEKDFMEKFEQSRKLRDEMADIIVTTSNEQLKTVATIICGMPDRLMHTVRALIDKKVKEIEAKEAAEEDAAKAENPEETKE